jgi:hypothetical protein
MSKPQAVFFDDTIDATVARLTNCRTSVFQCASVAHANKKLNHQTFEKVGGAAGDRF